jgi:hypothetical protein
MAISTKALMIAGIVVAVAVVFAGAAIATGAVSNPLGTASGHGMMSGQNGNGMMNGSSNGHGMMGSGAHINQGNVTACLNACGNGTGVQQCYRASGWNATQPTPASALV